MWGPVNVARRAERSLNGPLCAEPPPWRPVAGFVRSAAFRCSEQSLAPQTQRLEARSRRSKTRKESGPVAMSLSLFLPSMILFIYLFILLTRSRCTCISIVTLTLSLWSQSEAAMIGMVSTALGADEEIIVATFRSKASLGNARERYSWRYFAAT